MNSLRNLMLDAAATVGSINGMNMHAFESLAHRLEKAGKPLGDMTITEFMEHIDAHRADFNRRHSDGG